MAERNSGALASLGNKALGVAFLVVLALSVAFCIAVFQQRFTPVVTVTLLTDRIGSQLQEASDVKIRGLNVGAVRSISSTGSGATVTLALRPESVGQIPQNVHARLLPKTLFGERYVDLVVPDAPSKASIGEGDTIGQDRTTVAIELEKVFDDLLPLLRTVQPEKLSATLNALASTLEGRGTQLGKNLVLVDNYFKQLNPHMPNLQADISGLADLASTYSEAAPELIRAAKAFLTTNATLVEKQNELAGFLAGTAGFANTATAFLSANEDRIIQVGRINRPSLQLFARYSPEYPCLAQGMAGWIPQINDVFSNSAFHITLEFVPARPGYKPGQEPAWGEHRGPGCMTLPNPGTSQANPRGAYHFNDGGPAASPGSASAMPPMFSSPTAFAIPSVDSGMAGTASEQQVVAALMSADGSVPPSAIQTLLYGPILRGNVVNNQ